MTINETTLHQLINRAIHKQPRISYVYFSNEIYAPIIILIIIGLGFCALLIALLYLEMKKLNLLQPHICNNINEELLQPNTSNNIKNKKALQPNTSNNINKPKLVQRFAAGTSKNKEQEYKVGHVYCNIDDNRKEYELQNVKL